MSGLIAVSFGEHWIRAGWVYRCLLKDAIALHGEDAQLADVFRDAIDAGYLYLYLLDDSSLEKRATAAIVETARKALSHRLHDTLRCYQGLDKEHQEGYRHSVAPLVDLLDREGGRERVGVVVISAEKSWVASRWIFDRLFADVAQLHGHDPSLARQFKAAASVKGLRLHTLREEVASAVRAAISQTIRATFEPSSSGSLHWHVALDEEGRQAYIREVGDLLGNLNGPAK